MLKWLRLLLFPFSLIYGLVTAVRNWMFDTGILRSVKFDIPVISVGNITIGGTGKTPFTEYLVEQFSDYKVAILSRGYGRQTRGLVIADASANAKTIGDEPMQYYTKFPGVTVAVCEDRVKGINYLKAEHDLILLDDAFQHRYVQPGFSVLLFKYSSFFNFQMLLPAGDLRELFSGYKRADHI
ncbi:MAG: tetraacyldisaccharide 4'-kinase, partial [Chitinophagaceae bacterium]